MKYTVSEFAKQIRNLYPGDYDDLNDTNLVELWLKKYPNDINKIKINNEPVYIKQEITNQDSNWGKQAVFFILIIVFLFFSYKKNPTKELFTQELLKEYAINNGLDTSSSMLISEFTNSLFGGFVEPMIKRNDFIIFSTYEVELNNQLINGKVTAIRFWDNIFFVKKTMNVPNK